jgi:hypothetical protein
MNPRFLHALAQSHTDDLKRAAAAYRLTAGAASDHSAESSRSRRARLRRVIRLASAGI